MLSPADTPPGTPTGTAYYIRGGGTTARTLAHSAHPLPRDLDRAPGPHAPANPDWRLLFRLAHDHPLRGAYHHGPLGGRVAAAVRAAGLPSSTCGVYRQGYADGHPGSVPTLLVMAAPAEAPLVASIYATARQLVAALERLLVESDLPDVHVEVAVLETSEDEPPQ